MNINIAFGCDNNYVAYLGVALVSMVSNISEDNTYSVYILDDNISDINKLKLKKILPKNVSITFIDANIIECDRSAFYISGHVSLAAYLRIFLPEILPQCEKVIYADCDVIFTKDIAQLYCFDINDYYIAAVRDIGLIYQNNVMGVDDYYKDILGIDNIEDYFNSGVMLFNLDRLRKENIPQAFTQKLLEIKQPRFHDQDILNAVCNKHIKYLPLEYNYWGNFKMDCPNWNKNLPLKYKDAFDKAAEDPIIIHGKPWKNPWNEHSEIFFENARKSPFYECIIYENMKNIITASPPPPPQPPR